MRALTREGRHELEGFVVWSGAFVGNDRFRFSTVHHPEQQATSGPDGCLVTVSGLALFELNRRAFSNGEILAAQVHSHPGEAYHSETDDSFPLVTLPGALSVVIHDFARHGLNQRGRWAWYRLDSSGNWLDLDGRVSVVVK